MPWGVAAAAIGGALISSNGAQSAASTQASAQNQSTQMQQQMFNTIQGNEQPYMQAGQGTLSELLNGFGIGGAGATQTSTPTYGGSGGYAPQQNQINNENGRGMIGLKANMSGYNPNDGYRPTPGGGVQKTIPGPSSNAGGIPTGYFNEQFDPNSVTNNPAYKFALSQGDQAITNGNTPTQGALSGANTKALENFNVGTANSYENQYFNQFQQQQNSIFSRLSAISGLGQNAASNTGNNGAQLGVGAAQSNAAAGAARAAGQVGTANAISSGLNTAGMMAYLQSGSDE